MKKPQRVAMVVSKYFIPHAPAVLRDSLQVPLERPIQVRYMNDVTILFIKKFSLFYTTEVLTEKDKSDLRRYLEKMIEAKEAVSGTVKL